MLQRIRQFFSDADVTIGIVAGVVGGFALINLVRSLATDFVVPVLANAVGKEAINGIPLTGPANNKALVFNWADMIFNYTTAVVDAVTLIVIALAIFVVFVAVRTSSDEDDRPTRECPECRSEIPVDARRCRFCTSVVEPAASATQS
jgi:large conductance mechanosensitive channel